MIEIDLESTYRPWYATTPVGRTVPFHARNDPRTVPFIKRTVSFTKITELGRI